MKHLMLLSVLLALVGNAIAADKPNTIGSPAQGGADGKPADMTKPVKVFIMLGQSNMVGLGNITQGGVCPLEVAVKQEKLYPFLLDAAGNWAERKDVRNVSLITTNDTTEVTHNEWLKVGAGEGKMAAKMGTEYGIGHVLGDALEEPVMLLKSCTGNRSLGHDLLPPGSKGYDFVIKDKQGNETTYTYAGYKERPMRWVKDHKPEPPARGPDAVIQYDSGYREYSPPSAKNPKPAPTINPWYGGIQYDWDTVRAKKALAELDTYYPGAKGYEVAGFFFWQGEKDSGDPALAAHYEENLVYFIKQLRKDFNAPDAKFVLATLGECVKGMPVDKPQSIMSNRADVLNAHLAVDGASGKYPEFKGNVAAVYTHPMAQGGEGNGHYGHNSKVYMDVGLAMGEAMIKLLNGSRN